MQRMDEREIRRTVVERYGARARHALETEAAEARPPAAGGAIQFLDLSSPELSAGESSAGACCGPDDACGITVGPDVTAEGLYAGTDVGALPAGAIAASAGCGNPVAIAELQPGERVLDLGSGGGIDCLLAAQQVGPQGEVWGLDMTPDMVALARENARKVGAERVRFRLGEIEDIPFPDATFDVLISNCVINLSTDKPAVFAEAWRVLRPGGRLRVSDIVLTRDLPPEVAGDLAQWAGCVAGALPVAEYVGLIAGAGFTEIAVDYPDPEAVGERGTGIAGAYVTAVRP